MKNNNRIFKMKYGIIIILLALLIAGCNKDTHDTAGTHKEVYTCPMHPQVISDKPGVCPICHMDLVLKTEAADSTGTGMEEILDLGSNEALLANLKTIKVQKSPVAAEVKAFSTLDFAEENKRTISARFSGRIEKLYANKTGDYIRKGEPLFEIYSPELIQAQNDYVLGLNNKQLSPVSEERLKLLGISLKQIEELDSTKAVKNTMIIHSPYSGTVLEKKVQEGMYVNEGTILYDIADLSTLWNMADVYEADLKNIKPGSRIKLRLQSYPGEEFQGRVSLIYPVIDSKARTVKVRSVVSNAGNKLKPNMYGETFFETGTTEGIFIPSEAILMTGDRNLVYVKMSEGKFKARDVKLGSSYNGNYEILSGLNAGEEIAFSGGYLIDSEARLRGFNNNSNNTHVHNTP